MKSLHLSCTPVFDSKNIPSYLCSNPNFSDCLEASVGANLSLSHPSLCVSAPSAVRLPADLLRGAAHAAALPDRQGTDPRAHLVNRTVLHSVEHFPPDSLLCSASKGERESPSSRRAAGPAHRRHVRTIQEVRTTITRIITDVYYEDGKEVERKVSEVTRRFTLQFAFLCFCTGKGCCLRDVATETLLHSAATYRCRSFQNRSDYRARRLFFVWMH